MALHLKITGALLIALSMIHIPFPRYFQWRKELETLSLINRQMMYIHTFFIGLVVFLMGVLCLTSSQELLNTSLGNKLSLGLGVFWGVRLFSQFFGYSPKLWQGKRFETYMHIFFSALWVYFSAVFIMASHL